MAFGSLDGVSKVGYYDGNGQDGRALSLGFQPRLFIITKDGEGSWFLFSSVRGFPSGNDRALILNTNSDDSAPGDLVDTTSSDLLVNNHSYVNASGSSYCYYAHA